MANTVLTLEDLQAFEARMKEFIERRLTKMEEKPTQMFYTPAEVAAMVGLGVHAIRHKLRDPNEKHLKGIQPNGVCGTWLIPKESLDAWLGSINPKKRMA
jgi:hypothetical protein